MDGAFLLLVLFGGFAGGVPIMPLAGGMGTLDMLGSNFSHFLILMGICLMDGVAGGDVWLLKSHLAHCIGRWQIDLSTRNMVVLVVLG